MKKKNIYSSHFLGGEAVSLEAKKSIRNLIKRCMLNFLKERCYSACLFVWKILDICCRIEHDAMGRKYI